MMTPLAEHGLLPGDWHFLERNYKFSAPKHIILYRPCIQPQERYQVEAGTQLPHTIEVGTQLVPPN